MTWHSKEWDMHPKIVAIIQARRSSTRLPDKVLLDIGGKPMLTRVVERARRSRRLDEVVVATTTDEADSAIEALCQERGYPCYRGSLHDVLDRYYQAARLFQAQVVVRLTGDCPLIDPGLIDDVVDKFLGEDQVESSEPGYHFPFDFAANRLPPPWHRTYPIGLDVEVCTFQALERAWKEGDQPRHREHVLPYLYEQAGRFRVLVLNHDPDYGSLRWTVDTPADLELARQVFARFGGMDDFTWLDVLALFQREPQLAEINAQAEQKDYRQVENDGRAAHA
jgi:spore coat polysaccharide biosynthesis protein SpsF